MQEQIDRTQAKLFKKQKECEALNDKLLELFKIQEQERQKEILEAARKSKRSHEEIMAFLTSEASEEEEY
ncbi:MAG: hypothetical protein VZR00_09470 [Lachnospiraceae bacterium]|nr:hypothetical protein [Lachnospiraceae bacterium]